MRQRRLHRASVHLRGGVQVPSEAPGLQGRRAVHALPRVPLEPLPEEGSCPAPHAEPGVLRLPRPLRTFGVWVGVHHSSDWARVGLHAVDAPPSALRATGAPAAECVERARSGRCGSVCAGVHRQPRPRRAWGSRCLALLALHRETLPTATLSGVLVGRPRPRSPGAKRRLQYRVSASQT